MQEFQRLRDLLRDGTRSVAERYQTGWYLVGRPGSSKTHTVVETLNELDVPWTYRNARMSALGLWALLEEHPEDTVVLDDIPILLKQEQALQILMAAVGGEPGKPRPVTYTIKSKEDRKSFDFVGGIIAISNVPLRRDPFAAAVVSRIVTLEHEPTDEMLAAFMRQQALKGYQDLSPVEAKEVVEFVIGVARASDYRLDLRWMTKAWQDYRLVKHGKARRSWQDLVKSSIKRIIKEGTTLPEGRADTKARQQQVALELFKRFPDIKDKAERDEQWKDLTGRSPDTLYRRRRELVALGELQN